MFIWPKLKICTSTFVVFVCLFIYQDSVLLCSNLGGPGTSVVDQTDPRLIEILLPLHRKCCD